MYKVKFLKKAEILTSCTLWVSNNSQAGYELSTRLLEEEHCGRNDLEECLWPPGPTRPPRPVCTWLCPNTHRGHDRFFQTWVKFSS